MGFEWSRAREVEVGPVGMLCAGIVVGVALAPWLGGSAWLWAAAAAVACASGTPFGRGVWPRTACLVAGVSLGCLSVFAMPAGPALEGRLALQGVVVGASVGRTADVAVTRWARPGGAWSVDEGRVRIRCPERPPAPGRPVLVAGVAGPVRADALPGEPDPVRGAARARIRTEIDAVACAPIGGSPIREDRFAGARHGALSRALLDGDVRGVDPETLALFRRTGIVHLLSVSGFHVGVIAGLVGLLARSCLRVTALWRPEGLPESASFWIAALVGIAYSVSVGAPVPAVRAAGMVALVAVARSAQREIAPLDLVAAVAAFQLLWDPAAVASPAFQLSYGAILGLLRVTPRITACVPPDAPRAVSWGVASLATTAGATLGTLPAAAWWFQEVAPLAPVANLFAIPIVTFGALPCAALVQWGPHPIAPIFLFAGDRLLALLCALLCPLAVAPWTPAVGPSGALLLLCTLAVPRRPAAMAGLAILALGLRARPAGVLVVTFLDVGQGQATLVEHADGRVWLVDGGPRGSRVLKWLRRRGTRHLDAVYASHAHPDHTGGLVPVLGALTVDELVLPEREGMDPLLATASLRRVPVRLHPSRGLPAGADANERSLPVFVPWPGGGVLLPGDVGPLAESVLSVPGTVAVLAVPHHGSRSSSTGPFLDRIAPRLAIASSGRGHPFGHPHAEAVARYAERSIPLFRTDRQGTVEVVLDGASVGVRSWVPGRGWVREGRLLVGPTGGGAEEDRDGERRDDQREAL